MHKELDELQGERTRQAATPAIDELERQLAQIDIDLAKARQRTLPNHPDQIALMKSREAAQASLQQKIDSLAAGKKARADTVAGMLRKVNDVSI